MHHAFHDAYPETNVKRQLALACALLAGSLPALAQDCNPLRIVVGLAPGGGADTIARALAQRLSARHGTTAIVENKTGAGGNIAADYVARAPKDGCTLLLRGSEHHVNAVIYSRPGYELKDFAPIAQVVNGPTIIVAHPAQPFKTLPALVSYAKANPGKLSYGATAAGSGSHVPMELFLRVAGIRIVHIPYKGGALSLADTTAGLLPVANSSVSVALPLIQSGKLVPLAVASRTRWPTLPNVPTMAEAGYPDANLVYWMGLLAPAGTPEPVQDKLNQQVRAILEEPAVRERLLAQGYEAAPGARQEFVRFLRNDEQVSRKLMQELKLKVE